MQLITLWKCYQSAEERHLTANSLVPNVPAYVRDRWGYSALWGAFFFPSYILPKPSIGALLIKIASWLLLVLLASPSSLCPALLYSKRVRVLSDEEQDCVQQRETCVLSGGCDGEYLCLNAVCASEACCSAGSYDSGPEKGVQGPQVDLPYVFWQRCHLVGCLSKALWWTGDRESAAACRNMGVSKHIAWCRVLASVAMGCWSVLKAETSASGLLNPFHQNKSFDPLSACLLLPLGSRLCAWKLFLSSSAYSA